jgi:hypothetical protein
LQERAILITRRDCGSFLMALPCMRECEIIYIYMPASFCSDPNYYYAEIKRLISFLLLVGSAIYYYYIMSRSQSWIPWMMMKKPR